MIVGKLITAALSLIILPSINFPTFPRHPNNTKFQPKFRKMEHHGEAYTGGAPCESRVRRRNKGPAVQPRPPGPMRPGESWLAKDSLLFFLVQRGKKKKSDKDTKLSRLVPLFLGYQKQEISSQFEWEYQQNTLGFFFFFFEISKIGERKRAVNAPSFVGSKTG